MKQPIFASMIKNAFALLFCVAMLGAVVVAQENTGSIQGSVKDSSGAIVPGAKVSLSGPALVRSLDATTDSQGGYIFPKVPAGTYTVTVAQSNFKTVKNEEIKVVLGFASNIDVVLTAGNISEAVTITAAGDTIDVTSSKAATNITQEFVDKTPRGRQFHSLLVVAPGVRAEPKSGSFGVGGFQINGASGSENTFIVDGVDVSDVRRGALRSNDSLPFEFVKEVQVKTAGFEAEYTGTMGGVVNVVSRSGSNEFHGDVWTQMNGAALNSRPRGLWRRTTADVTKNEFFRAKEDEYRTFFPGFTLGGPIIKERLNFFTGYTADLNRTERTIPFAAGTRTTTQRVISHRGVARVDYAPTQKLQINTSYFWNPVKQVGALSGNDPSVAIANANFATRGGFVPASNYTASAVYTVTPKLILEARYGYKYLNDKNLNYGLPAIPFYTWDASTAPGTGGAAPSIVSTGKLTQAQYDAIPVAFRQASGFANTASTLGVVRDITTRHNVYLNAIHLTNWFGQRHSFKGGYALNRLNNDVLSNFTQGAFRIVWGESFNRPPVISNVKGTYGHYIWRDGVRLNAQVNSRNQGYYVQDSWQVLKNLTINAGVRLENEFLPPYTKEGVGGAKVANPISFGWGDKIAPLIGGAWDVRGDGKWKISASYGQYFDLMKYELARGSFGGDYWHDHVYLLNDPDISKLTLANPAALAGGTPKVIDINHRTVQINAQGQLDGIDTDIKPMSSRQYSLALDHEIKPGIVFNVRYTRSRLVRGIEDIGVLDAGGNEVYTIGNPGFGSTDATKVVTAAGVPLTPKAVRNFDGVEFRLDGRFSEGMLRRFNYNVSYTYSRLYGNWGGLANSDENGRSDPNVSRAFDLSPANFDSKGQNVFGLLATDRPHTAKFFINYSQPWSSGETLFSINQLAYSGTPLSSTVGFNVPVFFNGRGDLGRTPAFMQTDLLISHTINLGERVKMKFDANFTNLLNQASVTNTDQSFNRNGNIDISETAFFKGGWNVNTLVNPVNSTLAPAKNINYQFPTQYQGIRDVRLGVRLTF